ncbi:unnamed protein product [Blepharisma stoltei]|uniref:Histidine--tRNA ligase, cytoplasmic n=1 Tax=Blepharisma stoltei TaxID=1481888 RepID=A0AAU9IG72_9CILI|nr:unnamed protein product [Blepharisma stoltei]
MAKYLRIDIPTISDINMEKASLLLSGGNLSIADISKIHSGLQIVLDTETLQSLSEDFPTDTSPLNLTHELTKLDAVVGLNALLRLKDKAHSSLVSQFAERINHPGLLSLEGLEFTAIESKHFFQKKNLDAARIALLFDSIRITLPLLDAGLAFSFEVQNLDGSIFQDPLYSGVSNGVKTSLVNLESLLLDSKMAKKNQPNEAFIDAAQLIGTLRALIEDESKTIEREINNDVFEIGKSTINRSRAPLIKAASALSSLVIQLFYNSEERKGTISETRFQTSSNLEEIIELLRRLVPDLQNNAYAEIMQNFSALEALEKKINEGASKPRPILLGKGNKILYTHLKETQSNALALSNFLDDLFQARNNETRVPKLAKGMKDYGPDQMAIREKVFNTIRNVFKKHMAGELDTPVMELRETLTGKYGDESSKLIYNLADQGGEQLSLRYDLTVPLARYVAMNRLNKWKRFQIGKVYRRDQPQMKRGRFREFYQCDFDLIGTGPTMMQDAEVLKIVSEILVELNIGFVLKVSHRKLLDSLLDVSGCPVNKRITISSSIDKLDKEEWEKVRQEMIADKGLSPECADKIGEFVNIKGSPREVLQLLKAHDAFKTHELATSTIAELEKLAEFLECLEITPHIVYDLSLARGLDYYTGLVYEAVLTDTTQGVGSIAGGGRYDELIMKLNNSKNPVPAVGVALGIERIFTIIEDRFKKANLMYPKTSVLVAQAGNSDKYNLMNERIKICNLLWKNGIPSETSYKEKSDPKGQAGYASEAGISWIVWIGETELDEGKVKVKSLEQHNEEYVEIGVLSDYIVAHSS